MRSSPDSRALTVGLLLWPSVCIPADEGQSVSASVTISQCLARTLVRFYGRPHAHVAMQRLWLIRCAAAPMMHQPPTKDFLRQVRTALQPFEIR